MNTYHIVIDETYSLFIQAEKAEVLDGIVSFYTENQLVGAYKLENIKGFSKYQEIKKDKM